MLARHGIRMSLAIATITTVAPATWSQQDASRGVTRTETESRRGVEVRHDKLAGNSIDRFFVACAKNGNENEVALSRLAESKATNPEVKAFASQMVKEHSAFLEKLNRYGAGHDKGATRADADRTTGEKTTEERRTSVKIDRSGISTTTTRDAGRQDQFKAAHHDAVAQLIAIDREIAERCLASSRRELESKQGAKFDMCYMGMQMGAHMHMIDALNVVQKHVSPDLQQVFADAAQSSEQHMQHARRLMESLEKNSQSTAARDTDSRN